MTRIIIQSNGGQELEVEKATFDAGFFPDYWYVRDASGSSTPGVPAYIDADIAALVPAASGSATSTALRAALGSADPVLSNFSYDATTGNLLSYQEDGITITLTYNADGTVATSQRGTAAAKTYSYTGGNLVGVA